MRRLAQNVCPHSGSFLVCGILPANLRIKSALVSYELLTCVSTAQARTKCVSTFCAQAGAQHFACESPYEVAMVKCLHAYRLRRHFSCIVPHASGSCEILICTLTVQAHTQCGPRFLGATFFS